MKEPIAEVLKAARKALAHFTGAWMKGELAGPLPVDPCEVMRQIDDYLRGPTQGGTWSVGGIIAPWVEETDPPPPARVVNFREFL